VDVDWMPAGDSIHGFEWGVVGGHGWWCEGFPRNVSNTQETGVRFPEGELPPPSPVRIFLSIVVRYGLATRIVQTTFSRDRPTLTSHHPIPYSIPACQTDHFCSFLTSPHQDESKNGLRTEIRHPQSENPQT
jgi:hypothetical protein